MTELLLTEMYFGISVIVLFGGAMEAVRSICALLLYAILPNCLTNILYVYQKEA